MREGTLKQLNVKVGDKVRPINNGRGFAVENGRLLVITNADHNYAFYQGRKASHPEEYPWSLSDLLIFRLEEEAMEIKVGDEVEVCNSLVGWEGSYTVLAIQDRDKIAGRLWYVVAFMGDVPQVFQPSKVRKPKPTPVVVEMVGGPIGGVWAFDALEEHYLEDTHKITFNLVDGEPDCNSIKMIKL